MVPNPILFETVQPHALKRRVSVEERAASQVCAQVPGLAQARQRHVANRLFQAAKKRQVFSGKATVTKSNRARVAP